MSEYDQQLFNIQKEIFFLYNKVLKKHFQDEPKYTQTLKKILAKCEEIRVLNLIYFETNLLNIYKQVLNAIQGDCSDF